MMYACGNTFFEAGSCEYFAWEPQREVIEVIHKGVTYMVWDVVLMHTHLR